VATLSSARFSVVSGGVACVVGVVGILVAFPALLKFDADRDAAADVDVEPAVA
jgi:hypothetical protein